MGSSTLVGADVDSARDLDLQCRLGTLSWRWAVFLASVLAFRLITCRARLTSFEIRLFVDKDMNEDVEELASTSTA